jgi:hypothetical protein
VRLKCVAALVLGVAVLLSAVFWLPPFARRGRGSEGPDPGAGFDGESPALPRSLALLAFDSVSFPLRLVAMPPRRAESAVRFLISSWRIHE